MTTSIFTVTILLSLSAVVLEGKQFVRLCYFTSWTRTRASPYSRFDIEQIDPTLCTHLVYAFGKIDTDSHRLVPAESGEDSGLGQTGRYQRFNDLKKSYPHLKTLLSVGGETAHSETFLSVTQNDVVLRSFAKTSVNFLRKRGFDGLDLDWEYPTVTTKVEFTKLLKALRTEFDSDNTGREKLLLTVALAAGKPNIDNGYEVAAINRYVDLANLMTYDYHGSWSSVTGFDSPLYSRISDPKNFDPTLSTHWTVQYYHSKGLSKDKIVVGVTGAGARFKLQSENMTDVGAPAVNQTGTSVISDIWQLPYRFAYPEICRILQSVHSHRTFDEEQGVPFVVLGDEWVGYEDPESIKRKVKYMLTQGVAGVMFWELDFDDFTGKMCDAGKFPLLRALNEGVGKLESTYLTENVNPHIRYMTKYTGGAAGFVQNTHLLQTVFAVAGGLLFVRAMRRN